MILAQAIGQGMSAENCDRAVSVVCLILFLLLLASIIIWKSSKP